jgi:hypothetical protein
MRRLGSLRKARAKDDVRGPSRIRVARAARDRRELDHRVDTEFLIALRCILFYLQAQRPFGRPPLTPATA